MQAVLVSHNRKKIAELRAILAEVAPDLTLLSADEAGLPDDIVEDGDSFAANALIKARAAASLGYIGIADDSGLTVDALDGAPGIYSARYAGEHGDDAANNEKLLRELAARPDAPRTAAFVCAMACVFPDGESFTCEGRCPGEILFEARGEGGFGYDPLFFYAPAGVSFAELSPAEKNKVSHRARALAQFAPELGRRLAARNG
ncbi:MAG: RdgB/HAM1 family non-canonical purine NTP pyrophosphatase [Clostridia bacterium]|nr:RdgB/HAM1 family non-canonical purine NTP pyrophosphatase [Clostridia bacterium]